jgi:hypothetical protein
MANAWPTTGPSSARYRYGRHLAEQTKSPAHRSRTAARREQTEIALVPTRPEEQSAQGRRYGLQHLSYPLSIRNHPFLVAQTNGLADDKAAPAWYTRGNKVSLSRAFGGLGPEERSHPFWTPLTKPVPSHPATAHRRSVATRLPNRTAPAASAAFGPGSASPGFRPWSTLPKAASPVVRRFSKLLYGKRVLSRLVVLAPIL